MWEGVSDNTAKVTVMYNDLEQCVFLTVDVDGRLLKAWFPRWSNANAEKKYKLQTFGGYLSQYKEFSGFRLPTHIKAGNNFNTPEYFSFFIMDISSVCFPTL